MHSANDAAFQQNLLKTWSGRVFCAIVCSMRLKKFTDLLAHQLNLRETTIDNYKRVLQKTFQDLGTQEPGVREVEDYWLTFCQRQCSISHINNTAVILECYMRYLGHPVKLRRKRGNQTLIKSSLTEGEVARMLAAAKSIREQAMMAILAYAGIRNRELCNLRVRNVNLDSNFLQIINGKGGHDRVAYISRECAKIISCYLSEYPRRSDEYLFTSLAKGKPYNGWALRRVIRVVAKRAGITKRVHPHLFRHSLATNLIKKGANLVTVQNQLGHARLETTLRYVQSCPQRIQDEYQYFVPSYV